MRLLLTANLAVAAVSAQTLSMSLFVPVAYVSNTFRATILGSVNEASATTFAFSPGCANRPCGPVTVIQGPGTAIFSAADQPITTVWDCKLAPDTDPTFASCLLTSTSPGNLFPGTDTKTYPPGSGFAFPTYKAIVAAGSITGGSAPTSTGASDGPSRSSPSSSSSSTSNLGTSSGASNASITPAPSSTPPAQTGGTSGGVTSTTATPSRGAHLQVPGSGIMGLVGIAFFLSSTVAQGVLL